MGLRNLALQARVAATAPFRRARLRELCQQGAAPMFVPFYHRVADKHPNDWTISCQEFERHVRHCKEHFEPVGLDEVQRRVREGVSRPTITFTFDDGYAENCDFALPLLIEQGIPTVYFTSINFVKEQRPFPHDVEAGMGLPVNTEAQIREMADMGIEIGLHTREHVDFSKVHDAAEIRSEIIEAKDELEQMIGRAVRYFAFPYGLPKQLTEPAIEAVHEAGMMGFTSAFGAYNVPGRDAFHIRRFHGDPEFSRLLNWLSFDQRKLDREPTIPYVLPPATSFQAASNTMPQL